MIGDRNALQFVPVLLLGIVLGGAIGFGYYQLSWALLKDSKTKEKATILRLTDAFVTAYSSVRSSTLNKTAPVPATYRAHAIDAFNRSAPEGDAISVVMVGAPGRSIKTEPLDAEMAENIRAFANAVNPGPSFTIIENSDGPVLRTLYPSIAKKKSCVDCHNKIQGTSGRWAINDVMGAFAVDAPVGFALSKLQRDSSIVGILICLFAWIVGVYLQNDISRRKASVRMLTNAKDAAESALERAENAERVKSEFLANMSHEIRTPMNGVMGMADLLSATNLDERQRKFTNVIVSSSSALLKIINDILDFSKMNANQLVLETRSFDLAREIDDVATLMSKNAQEKGLELAVRVEPDMPGLFFGDAGRIRQVIINLVGNAVKFTENGSVLIDASTSDQADLGDNVKLVTLTIRDTGGGIPKDKIGMIFGKFQQVDGSSTRQHDGTGLGLAITKRLVEIMGGEIGVDSAVGFGSTFWIKIPLEIDLAGRTPAESQTDLSAKSVLIVDDSEVNRSILREQLSARKILTQSAVSGVEGLEQLRTAEASGQPIDFVILDYHMPAMNGAEVVRAIRADEKIKNTPILLLTSVDYSVEFDALPVDGQMAKPVSSNVLFNTMATILRKSPEENPKVPVRPEVTKKPVITITPAAPAVPAAPAAKESRVSPRRLKITPVKKPAPKPGVAVEPQQSQQEDARVPLLIVDDNETNLLLLREILKTVDLDYISARDGLEAIALAESASPRVILMDVSMPGINGLDATRTIRQVEADKGIPRSFVIGQTGHALHGDEQKCRDAGMDDYITKPISAADLLKRIDHWLEVSSSQAENQVTAQSNTAHKSSSVA